MIPLVVLRNKANTDRYLETSMDDGDWDDENLDVTVAKDLSVPTLAHFEKQKFCVPNISEGCQRSTGIVYVHLWILKEYEKQMYLSISRLLRNSMNIPKSWLSDMVVYLNK